MQSLDTLSQPVDTTQKHPNHHPSDPHISQDPKVSKSSWYISLALFVTVITGTFALYGFNYFQQKTVVELQNQIQASEKQIAEVSKDRDILIAKILINGNTIRPSIDVAGQVKNFYAIAKEAGVEFQGFSIQNDIIKTNLIASTDGYYTTDPVVTVIQMMRDHNKNIKPLKLHPIKSITGDPKKRTTGIELIVTK